MLEYEHKVILTPEEYRCISEHLAGGAPSSVQTNYYYDTDDMKMNGKKTTCRIREKNGIYTAVIKEHLPTVGLSKETVICTGESRDAEVSGQPENGKNNFIFRRLHKGYDR